MNRRTTTIAMFLCVGLLGLAAVAAQLVATGQSMTESARVFLEGLSEEQRETALLAYDDPARLDWHFVPMAHRKGLSLGAMDEGQREQAHQLLRTALSEAGYEKTTRIIQLEVILDAIEDGGLVRDPERYYFTLFGEPDLAGRWGLSVEGHHLSLNFVVDEGQVEAHTPMFFGANPGIVKDAVEGALAEGTRILADEERLAFGLLHALSDEQRATAVIAEQPLQDVRSAGEPQPPNTEAVGLAGGEMDTAQRAILRDLIEVYLTNMPADVAAERRAEVQEAGYDAVHFAWAGADEPGVGHYYRLQGPTFLVELANTQPDSAGRPANHVHALWRDVRGDFGIHR
ncbi:MAG: DUF3500 domain-containing protein [Phycisphaeraceae bacterium]